MNEQVVHVKWGYGVITETDGDIITVNFDSEGIKKLDASIVFERNILQFKDLNRQEEYLSDLKKHKDEESVIIRVRKEHIKRSGHQKLLTNTQLGSSRDNATAILAISAFETGKVYTNNDLSSAFLTSPQGGMRKSNRTNSLVLISKHSVNPEINPYEDNWQNGVFHYTGMGRVGDQSLDFAQNKTLGESNRNGVNIYLFESYHSNEYIYRGKMQLAGEPYPIQESDSNGNARIVYKFPLKSID